MGHKWKRLSIPPPATRTQVERVGAALRSGFWDYREHAAARVGHLERLVAERLGVPPVWVLATSSCTAALAAAQEFFFDDGKDDLIRLPVMTYPATSSWLALRQRMSSLDPRVMWVDVADNGWPAASVDVGVELWGRPWPGDCPWPAVLDAAHRFLCPRHATAARAGTAVCYSFAPTKQLPSPGGGMLVWKNLEEREFREAVYSFLRSGQRWGARGAPPLDLGFGIKGLMQDDRAAFLLDSLKRFDAWQRRRRLVLEVYEEYLGKLLMTKPGEEPPASSGHLAVLRFPDAPWCRAVRARLEKAGIEYGIHYHVDSEDFPSATSLSARIVSIPCHTHLQPVRAARIAKTILTA